MSTTAAPAFAYALTDAEITAIVVALGDYSERVRQDGRAAERTRPEIAEMVYGEAQRLQELAARLEKEAGI
jgi:hypothetical protein